MSSFIEVLDHILNYCTPTQYFIYIYFKYIYIYIYKETK